MFKMQTSILLLNIFLVCLVLNIVAAQNTSFKVLDLRAARGRNAKLPCGLQDPVVGGKAEEVAWYKNERYLYRYPPLEPEIRAGIAGEDVNDRCTTKFCPNDSGLYLEKVSAYDAGLYRCRLFNDNIHAGEYYINLAVIEPAEAPTVYDLSNKNAKKVTLGFVGPYAIGSNVTLICQVMPVGPTQLYWTRDGQEIICANPKEPGMMQVSLHLFNITRAHTNAHYQCMAQNSDVSEPVATNATLTMITPPLSVEIRMDNNYNLEIDYPRVVDCVVVGSMPSPIIEWQIGGVTVKSNLHKEKHDGNYTISTLTLSSTKNLDGKMLSCKAYNTYIKNQLYVDQITLKVGYRPVCKTQTVKIGTVTKELETVACIVDADPAPEKILWTFADSLTMWSTLEKLPNAPNRYRGNITWLSRMDDIGPLLCQATNVFGYQKVPCSFNISSGGVPDVPNCSLQRSYPDSLRVRCVKGWDGGRPQIIHLDIVAQDGTHIKNLTDAEGMFFLPKVGFYGNMSAIIYASNKRGKSPVKTTFLPSLVPRMNGKPRFITYAWVPYLQALITLFAGVLAICIFTVCVRIVLATRDTDSEEDESPDGVFHREPDFLRQERQDRAYFTITRLDDCENQYTPVPTPPPPPAYRVVFDDIPSPTPDTSIYQSYYV